MNEMERMKEACKREGCGKNMFCYGGGVNKDLFCMSGERRFTELTEERFVIPHCHGKPMQPNYRYREGGKVFQHFVCNAPGCDYSEEIEMDKPERDIYMECVR